MIVDNNGAIKEQNDYYPFGMRYQSNSGSAISTNRYTFSGKEIQTTGNVNYLDFGARQYDEFLGRWFAIDPLAAKYYSFSPYNYCVNNPLRFIDPDGRDWYSYEDKNGDTQFKYFDYELSKKEVKAGGYTHLGKTYTFGNTYYSLFGNRKDLRTQDGQIYQKIDNVIISYANWHIKDERKDPYSSERASMSYIDVGIKTDKKQLIIEYEGSIGGTYNNYPGENERQGKINPSYFFRGVVINGQELPFQFNIAPSPVFAGKKGYYLVIENSSTLGERSSHIIDLSYSPEQAIKIREKYQKLFFGK